MTMLIKYGSWDPESGLNQNYINPFWLTKNVICHCKDASYTSQRFPTSVHGTFGFYLVQFFDLHLDGKTEDTFEPSTMTCPTATTTASAPASPQEKKKATQPLGHALDPSKMRKQMLQQPPGQPHTDIPGYQNLLGCHLPF